jgi:stage V sporulation protein B
MLSLTLSALCAFILWHSADFISTYFLLEERCTNSLKILSLSLPFNSIHSCICGYYLGHKKTEIPAISQLIEQSIRMIFLLMVSYFSQTISVEIAILALVIGEIASAIFCSLSIQISFSMHKETPTTLSLFTRLKKLLSLSLPLSANRLILSLLQSIEAIMIPSRLQLSGLNSTDALGIYGVFCGMAMPFILFPNSLTSALSMMLLPEVASEQAKNNNKRITYTAIRSSEYCLYMGILCTGLFIYLGNPLGELFFPNTQAGIFISTLAWICPFLYLNNTYTSILNGLGKASLTFSHQLTGIVLRLFCVVFIIPNYGIIGYFLGILLGTLLTCGLNYFSLRNLVHLKYNASTSIFRPIAIIILVLFICQSIPFSNLSAFWLLIAKGSFIVIGYLLFLFLTRRKEKTTNV